MMLQSSSLPQSATSATSHPRRAPAHLSVSLRHESSASENATAAASKVQHEVKGKDGRSKSHLVTQSSDDSNDSEGSTAPNLQRWFDRSNKRPEIGVPRALEDSKLLLCMIIRIGH
jgi:flagellar hook-length control protein FliK